MGLFIHTTFETPQGISITGVYCKISSFTCDILPNSEVRFLIKYETFLSREKRILGYGSISTPKIGEYVVVTTNLHSNWGTMSFLYTKLKENLLSLEFEVDDVLEEETVIE